MNSQHQQQPLKNTIILVSSLPPSLHSLFLAPPPHWKFDHKTLIFYIHQHHHINLVDHKMKTSILSGYFLYCTRPEVHKFCPLSWSERDRQKLLFRSIHEHAFCPVTPIKDAHFSTMGW